MHFHLRGCHPLWPAFPDRSINTSLSLVCSLRAPGPPEPRSEYCGPATPGSPFESPGLGSSEFARHYFRNHGCFLFLRVLRWFTSPSSLAHLMYWDARNRCSHRLGFPIRKSPDHSLLAAPRGLSQLTTSFIAYLRQGIHTHALSSLTIKSTSHTTERYFLRAYILVFCMPVNIQLSSLSMNYRVCCRAPDSKCCGRAAIWRPPAPPLRRQKTARGYCPISMSG